MTYYMNTPLSRTILVGTKTELELVSAGFSTVGDLVGATDKQLLAVKLVGPVTLQQIRTGIAKLLDRGSREKSSSAQRRWCLACKCEMHRFVDDEGEPYWRCGNESCMRLAGGESDG